MRLIIFLLAIIMLNSCALTKQQRRDNRVAKKIEKLKRKYPKSFENATTELVRIDTLIEEVEIEGKTEIDTLEVEKLVKEYIKDTIMVTRFINRFLDVTRDSVNIDSIGVHLRISGSGIVYSLKRDSIYIAKEQEVKTVTVTNTQVVKAVWYKDPFFWILIVVLLVFGLMQLAKMKIL